MVSNYTQRFSFGVSPHLILQRIILPYKKKNTNENTTLAYQAQYLVGFNSAATSDHFSISF